MATPHDMAPFRRRKTGLLTAACGLAGVATVLAQNPAPMGITVRETAGIRRTEYPVTAAVAWPRGAVHDVAHLRLRAAEGDLVSQFTPISRWDDGSLRDVEVDFNTSIGAGERRSLKVEVGTDTATSAAPRGALAVVESDDRFTVGRVALGRHAWPLLASASYRGEIVGNGPNGIALIDASGAAQAFGSSGDVQAQIIKPGPLLVVIRYTGRVVLGGGATVPVTLTCELPNSKSWMKMTLRVDDPERRIRRIRFDTPFALGPFPWLWDFGTDSGSYGVFRAGAERAVLTQQVGTGAAQTSWKLESGTSASVGVYEQSMPGRSSMVMGWGHVLDGRNAIAFAVDRMTAPPATHTFALTGEGGLSYEVAPAQGAARHEVVYYQHYVGTPVPIGAATSPAAMVKPLVVSLDR